MSLSPVAAMAKHVIEAQWLHGPSYDLATQAAEALESAQLLQSPETAEELAQLRDRVAALEAQREAVRAVHVQYADSPHCQHDGERWPCPTLAAIEGGER